MATDVIRYEHGHEYHPISPGRIVVELDAAGAVRASYQRLAKKRAWSGRQVPPLFAEVLAALESSGFPARPPPRIVPPDTQSFTIARTRGDVVESVASTPCPEYAEVSRLMTAILVQMAGDEVLGFALPDEPRHVTDVVEIT